MEDGREEERGEKKRERRGMEKKNKDKERRREEIKEKRGKERISRYDIESLTTEDPTLCSGVFGSVSVSLSLLFSAD